MAYNMSTIYKVGLSMSKPDLSEWLGFNFEIWLNHMFSW